MNIDKIEQGIKLVIDGLEIKDNEHIRDTPKRVAKAYSEIFEGLTMNPPILKIFNDSNQIDQMIISDNINFYSCCCHHLLTFRGIAKVGYIPRDGNIVGISKLARVVDYFAKRPTVQEIITNQVADFLFNSELKPLGVGVILKAEHDCEIIRGVKKPGSIMTTSALKGVFMDSEIREEFIKL